MREREREREGSEREREIRGEYENREGKEESLKNRYAKMYAYNECEHLCFEGEEEKKVQLDV